MKRLFSNLGTLIVVALGVTHLSSPPAALAAGEKCCTGSNSMCCGMDCRVDPDGSCNACNSRLSCWILM